MSDTHAAKSSVGDESELNEYLNLSVGDESELNEYLKSSVGDESELNRMYATVHHIIESGCQMPNEEIARRRVLVSINLDLIMIYASEKAYCKKLQAYQKVHNVVVLHDMPGNRYMWREKSSRCDTPHFYTDISTLWARVRAFVRARAVVLYWLGLTEHLMAAGGAAEARTTTVSA